MGLKNHRKVYDGAFKARVVLEALQGNQTLAEIASEYAIHPVQIVQWKKRALDVLPEILSRKTQRSSMKEQEELQDELYKQIGELKVQNEFLKKNLSKLPSLSKRRRE
jgi:transposase-like protein